MVGYSYCLELTIKGKLEGIKTATDKPSLRELLRRTLESIEAPSIRERIQKLIENDRLSSPLSHAALKKEAQELLSLLQEGGDHAEDSSG